MVFTDEIIKVIFVQTSFMKKKWQTFQLLDSTYGTNIHRMPVYTIMVEDNNGVSIPVSPTRKMQLFRGRIWIFCQKQIAVKSEVFLIDKDFTECDLIRKYFPEADVQFCFNPCLNIQGTACKHIVKDKCYDCYKQAALEVCNRHCKNSFLGLITASEEADLVSFFMFLTIYLLKNTYLIHEYVSTYTYLYEAK